MVYNDFYIGEDCDVDIVAGCGLSPTVRGEALGLEEYARLSDALLAAAGE